MDGVDFQILKTLSQGRLSMWDSLDPRVSSQDVADAVGIDRTTVAARLRAWRRTGFLQRTEVLPNPALFGARLAGLGVCVPSAREKAGVLERLRLVDGIAGVLDHLGPWLGVATVTETPAKLARTVRLVGLLPGVTETTPALETRTARCTVEPTAGDWRILRLLRQTPDASLAELAQSLGVHVKTFRRRYERLIDGHAVWVVPIYDFSRWEGAAAARLIVTFEPGIEPRAATRRMVRALDRAGVDAMGEPLYAEAPIVELFLHAPSVGRVEDAQVIALGCEGVAEVEIVFPRLLEMIPSWFDDQLERAMAANATARS